jgi:hypothetical protein
MNTYLINNTDNINKKVWKTKQEETREDHTNEGHTKFILSRLEIVQVEDKYTWKNKYVRYRKVWRRN